MKAFKVLLTAATGAGFIALIAASTARAASVAIGAPGDAADCVPFGCRASSYSSITRYQQVYNRNLFPDPLQINFVSFFNAIGDPGSIDPEYYRIYLSSTKKPVDGLNTKDLYRNVGLDNKLFFEGRLSGPIGRKKILSIEGNQFDYTPSKGNLLLEVRKIGGRGNPGSGSVRLDSRRGTFYGQSSRTYNVDDGFGENGSGLVTEFGSERPTSVPVPEPSSVLGALAFCAFLGTKFVLKYKN